MSVTCGCPLQRCASCQISMYLTSGQWLAMTSEWVTSSAATGWNLGILPTNLGIFLLWLWKLNFTCNTNVFSHKCRTNKSIMYPCCHWPWLCAVHRVKLFIRRHNFGYFQHIWRLFFIQSCDFLWHDLGISWKESGSSDCEYAIAAQKNLLWLQTSTTWKVALRMHKNYPFSDLKFKNFLERAIDLFLGEEGAPRPALNPLSAFSASILVLSALCSWHAVCRAPRITEQI